MRKFLRRMWNKVFPPPPPKSWIDWKNPPRIRAYHTLEAEEALAQHFEKEDKDDE